MQQEATVLSPRSPRAHMPETPLAQVLAPDPQQGGSVLGVSECCLDPEHVGGGTGSFSTYSLNMRTGSTNYAAPGYVRGRSFIYHSFSNKCLFGSVC